MFFKIVFLKNFANFTGKHLCWSLFFNKAAGLQTFIKKRLEHRCFPVKFTKFLIKSNLILDENGLEKIHFCYYLLQTNIYSEAACLLSFGIYLGLFRGDTNFHWSRSRGGISQIIPQHQEILLFFREQNIMKVQFNT